MTLNVSVLLSALVKRVGISRVRDFFNLEWAKGRGNKIVFKLELGSNIMNICKYNSVTGRGVSEIYDIITVL